MTTRSIPITELIIIDCISIFIKWEQYEIESVEITSVNETLSMIGKRRKPMIPPVN